MDSINYSAPERIFILAGRVSRALPAFRGKVRLFLLLYRLLGLADRNFLVEVTLIEPVRYRMQLDLRSWLQRLAFLTGSYEPETVRFLERLHSTINPCGYLLDIGANIGTICIPFSIRAAKNTPLTNRSLIRAIAVEAVPDNASLLRSNVGLNNLEETVPVFEVALGDTSKDVRIQVEGDLSKGEGTGTANILADSSDWRCVTQTIQVKMLDDLGLPSDCAVIKIDTDGYDLKVLQGATEYLRRSRPIVFGEFSAHCMKWHGQGLDDVISFASKCGYDVWMRLECSTRFTLKLDSSRYVQDLLLVPKENISAFAWCLQETAPCSPQ